MNSFLKNIILLSSVVFAGALATSCDIGNDIIIDVFPVNLVMEVQNASGANLLDTTTTGNLLGNKITATFRGKSYQRDSVATAYPTKAILPDFIGLSTVRSDGHNLLTFGELDGEEKISNEDVVIDWGDGTKSTITIYNKCTYDVSGHADVTRHYYLDGKQLESGWGNVTIVKK